jgi:hypothetical protein
MKHKMTQAEIEEAMEEMNTYFANLNATETGQLQAEINQLKSKLFQTQVIINSIWAIIKNDTEAGKNSTIAQIKKVIEYNDYLFGKGEDNGDS